MGPTKDLIAKNLPEVIAKHQLIGGKSVGVEDIAECKFETMRDEEDSMGDQCDLPIDKERVQQASLQRKS